MKQFYVLNYSQ